MRAGSVWLFQTTPTPTQAGTTTDLGGLLPVQIPVWVMQLLTALFVLTVAFLISRLLVRLLGRRIAQRFRRPSLTRTALRSIRVGVFILALLTVMNIYGLELGDIALSVTVFSAVIGVILAPIVGSIISGMFLLADQPYEIGDMIELADRNQRGFVEDITLRHTKIFTMDNTFLVIPNGEIRQRDVINYSAEDPRIRLSQGFLVTYESDIQQARTLIERAAQSCEGIIEGGPDIRIGAARYPASPTAYIDDFADHGVLLTLRYWAMEPYKLLTVRSRIQTAVWDELEDADVEIAYPHSHLYFDETSGEMQVSMAEESADPRDGQTLDELDEEREG
ncbi:mechanosensitive ion channel family protein [Halomicroarcula sp. GCM10025324]|uniref:mechanosensitive ion channel family protein n=1 Tax=Haloarcula TaxID=2237 RepID=UPI0023E8495E|nr:mechanosensitive ion channel family protein [Halomicroarcula sp. ZS-22-S1]